MPKELYIDLKRNPNDIKSLESYNNLEEKRMDKMKCDILGRRTDLRLRELHAGYRKMFGPNFSSDEDSKSD